MFTYKGWDGGPAAAAQPPASLSPVPSMPRLGLPTGASRCEEGCTQGFLTRGQPGGARGGPVQGLVLGYPGAECSAPALPGMPPAWAQAPPEAFGLFLL